MQKRTRHALAMLLPLIILSPIFFSCGGAGLGGTTLDGGYLGNTLSLSGSLFYADKTSFVPGVGDGTLTFSMQGSPSVDLVTTAVLGAGFSETLTTPSAGVISTWTTIMAGLPSPTVSDSSAKGFVINQIMFHRTSPVETIGVYQSNYPFTTVVFYAYTDKDVTSTASGTYNGPGGTASDTCDMSMSLKAGWNRIILTRTGTGPFSDTWRIGEAPSDVCWAYGW